MTPLFVKRLKNTVDSGRYFTYERRRRRKRRFVSVAVFPLDVIVALVGNLCARNTLYAPESSVNTFPYCRNGEHCPSALKEHFPFACLNIPSVEPKRNIESLCKNLRNNKQALCGKSLCKSVILCKAYRLEKEGRNTGDCLKCCHIENLTVVVVCIDTRSERSEKI